MQIHNLNGGHYKRAKLIGRGGKRGKTSGRGGKGQTARAGHRVRPEVRDLIKKLPKLRGYGAPRIKQIVVTTSLDVLNKRFNEGAIVTPKDFGKQKMKILSNGVINKKLTLQGFLYSVSAKKKIEASGSKII
ncbi:MAG TPA: uL15 family ribosomal protein [Candidatus Paceibacterota bacterium]